MLRDPAPAPAPPPVARPRRGQKTAPVVAPPPPPDLTRMLTDNEARIRRRAALAIGRVGLADGVAPLLTVLSDSDPEVRQMAAFALGLLGDRRAREPLIGALADPAPVVQGSAAEALGLLGDVTAADAIGTLVTRMVQSGAADPAARGRRRRAARHAVGRLPTGRSTPWSASRPTRSSRPPCWTATVSRSCAGGRSPSRCSVSKTSVHCRRC